MKHIVSYGGGVNSTALVVEMVNKKMPIDAIIFSNTGGERPETYAYIQYFSKWLQEKGYPKIVVVKYKTKENKVLTLEQDILKRKSLPPIAFGYKSCSDKFKIRPFDKWVKNNIEGEYIKYIGFDFGESKRLKKLHNVEYLLYDWKIDRNKCIEIILNAGLKSPIKSSCFFCPSMKKHEILALPEDLKLRVINIENNARPNLNELKGLGRQFAWKDLFHMDKTQISLFEEVDYISTPCACHG